MSQIVQYIALPVEDFNLLVKNQEIMMKALQNLNLTPTPDYLTVQEFLEQCKFSRWKYEILKNTGKLRVKQIGRKYYIAKTEVARYFNGELTLT